MKQVQQSAHLIGQDLSPTMIETARPLLDEVFVGDSLKPTVSESSVDVLFLRFLNSEVLDTQAAYERFISLIRTVKPNGKILMFGHTPVLISTGFIKLCNLNIQRNIGCNLKERVMFQFYEINT